LAVSCSLSFLIERTWLITSSDITGYYISNDFSISQSFEERLYSEIEKVIGSELLGLLITVEMLV